MKACIQCHENKLLSQFYKNVHMAGGRVNVCIACKNKAVAKRREDPQEVAELMYRWALSANQESGHAQLSQHH